MQEFNFINIYGLLYCISDCESIVGELLTRFKIIYIAIAGLTLFTVGSLMSGLSTHFSMLYHV